MATSNQKSAGAQPNEQLNWAAKYLLNIGDQRMFFDVRGLNLTTDSAVAVEAYDAGVSDYFEYRLSAGERAKAALAADPTFVMGQCLRGYFMLLIGSNSTVPAARKALEQARVYARLASEREQMHVAALAAWCEGDTRRASSIWQQIVAECPRDLLALRLDHFANFWRGESRALHDVPALALRGFDANLPGYGYALGMLAFGLEECGEYIGAEKTGRRCVEINPEDLWGIHAVAHVMEMEGRLVEGTTWLNQPTGTWADRNPFKDHLWWHTALFPLEGGDYDRVLALYDSEVKVDESGFYLDIQNAASLLLRLEFCGVDVGTRWRQLADIAEKRVEDHVFGFTDTHFMMALARDGRQSAAGALLESLRRFANVDDANSARPVASRVTIPVCEAIGAYADKHFDRAVEVLLPLRAQWQELGASHAQRDIFTQILIEAAIGANRTTLARDLLAERSKLKPNSHYTWQRYADALQACGELEEARGARARAGAVR
jgi:tetratricopeptide (TPR) repeat protein